MQDGSTTSVEPHHSDGSAPKDAPIIDSVSACWAGAGEERRETAGRCLGELVRKMGERVLSTIIPILAQGMEAPKVRFWIKLLGSNH